MRVHTSLSVLGLAAVLAWSSPAAADPVCGQSLWDGNCVYYTTIGIASVGLVVWAVDLTTKQFGGNGLLSYLRSNRVQLASDLSFGAGPTIDDLAAYLGVSDRSRFGRRLRHDRRRLLYLASDEVLDRAGAAPFSARVRRLAATTASDPRTADP